MYKIALLVIVAGAKATETTVDYYGHTESGWQLLDAETPDEAKHQIDALSTRQGVRGSVLEYLSELNDEDELGADLGEATAKVSNWDCASTLAITDKLVFIPLVY